MRRRAVLLILTMAATLLLASGVALAVSKVCPFGTTFANPCNGTAKTKTSSGNDTLIGTSGNDYIFALSGNDKISAGAGNDYTDGSLGNDTYSYASGWGTDTLVDATGIDHLNFSAVGGGTYYLTVGVVPEFAAPYGSYYNQVTGPNAEKITFSGLTTFIEKVTGSSMFDFIYTGKEANTLSPGPGTGGAYLVDFGGHPYPPAVLPVSNDLYTGFAASGYGTVSIFDWGGTADKLTLPFASTAAYFEAYDTDGDNSADALLIMSSSTDSIWIYGQLEPRYDQKGRIEQIEFTDETLSIGTDTQASSSATSTSTSSVEEKVAALNQASTLDASEKEKRSKAAKKIAAEAKKPAIDSGDSPSSPPSGGQG